MLHKLKPFTSLRFPDFRLYYSGTVLSEIGSQMQLVAINWQIYEMTGSAWSLGLIGLAGFLGVIIFALPAGLLADKHDRKKILMISQIIPCIFAFILAIATLWGWATPWLIYSMVFLTFAARTFQGPARQAIIPQLVPSEFLVNAFSLQTISRQLSLIIGPAIAGFMIQYWDVGSIYFLNGFSFIAYIATLAPIKIKMHQMVGEVSFSFKSMWEGIHFVWKSPILFYTMLLDFIANFFSSATTLLPIFAKDIFGVGPQGLGILYAAPAFGSIIAGLTMASLGNIRHQGKIILGAVTLYGLATAFFGLTNSFYLAIICLSLVGVGDMVSTVLRNTLRNMLTPDHIRGRMLAVNTLFIQGGPMIGETEAGLVAQFFGAPFSVFTGGVATVVATLFIWWKVPQLRNYHNHTLDEVFKK
jgi:MFS family permease